MKKYDNFCAALKNLEDIFLYKEPYDNVTITGLVGLYEICLEQAWKMMKELLEEHGFESAATGSPKFIIKTAYQASMITEEELWLNALRTRNNVAHSYNREIALDIVRQVKGRYYEMLCTLKQDIEREWL